MTCFSRFWAILGNALRQEQQNRQCWQRRIYNLYTGDEATGFESHPHRQYKDRWQIELFFKALKQSLKVKTFVGTSENAVQTQIWTALIAMLLVKYLQLRSTFGWSLSNLVALLRQQLFVYRDLMGWLNDPFQAPPALAGVHDGQLALELAG